MICIRMFATAFLLNRSPDHYSNGATAQKMVVLSGFRIHFL